MNLDLRIRPTPAVVSEALAEIRRNVGEVAFRKMCPRRINSPSTHVSHNLYRLCLISCHMAAIQRPEYKGAIIAAISARFAAQYNLPSWYVGQNLLEALLRTSPPLDLKPSEVHWPLDSLTFFLPENPEVKGWFGGRSVLWLTGTRVFGHPDGVTRVYLHTVCELPTEGMTEYHAVLREDQTLQSWLGTRYELDPETRSEFEVDFKSEDEQEFTQRLGLLSFSFVMMLGLPNPGPGFLQPGDPWKKRPKEAEPTVPDPHEDRVWEPAWLGRFYHPPGGKQTPGGGHHASPHVHWRKGHWHSYLTGIGRTNRKRIWVQPIIINAPTKGEQK